MFQLREKMWLVKYYVCVNKTNIYLIVQKEDEMYRKRISHFECCECGDHILWCILGEISMRTYLWVSRDFRVAVSGERQLCEQSHTHTSTDTNTSSHITHTHTHRKAWDEFLLRDWWYNYLSLKESLKLRSEGTHCESTTERRDLSWCTELFQESIRQNMIFLSILTYQRCGNLWTGSR